jgi:methionyl-tRNA formyltransferase
MRRLVYFGSDSFAVRVLDGIRNHHSIDSLQVATTAVTARSQKQEMLAYCKLHGIGCDIPVDGKDKSTRISQWKAYAKYLAETGYDDLGIVCSYGLMINSSVIDHFNKVHLA